MLFSKYDWLLSILHKNKTVQNQIYYESCKIMQKIFFFFTKWCTKQAIFQKIGKEMWKQIIFYSLRIWPVVRCPGQPIFSSDNQEPLNWLSDRATTILKQKCDFFHFFYSICEQTMGWQWNWDGSCHINISKLLELFVTCDTYCFSINWLQGASEICWGQVEYPSHLPEGTSARQSLSCRLFYKT